jgi:hypothetical protein
VVGYGLDHGELYATSPSSERCEVRRYERAPWKRAGG